MDDFESYRAHIGTIVGRCHVGEPNREVVKYVSTCFKWATCSPLFKRAVAREAIRCHMANVAEFKWWRF